jgi:hypothetical protein
MNLITKLINENKINLDEHIPTIFFSYKTTYKVTTYILHIIYLQTISFNAHIICFVGVVGTTKLQIMLGYSLAN